MESPRFRARGSMPHVASQWQSVQHQRGNYDGRLSTSQTKTSIEYLRAFPIPPGQNPIVVRQGPRMSLPATPENDRLGSRPSRHLREHSSDNKTRMSAVDSIFELPSESFESPISSTNSSFIAELEDTSAAVLRSQKLSVPSTTQSPAVSDSSMAVKCTDMTSRAVIKVVDETIAAIEDTNRKLLLRAIAAEKAAKTLREQNSRLELKVKHCCHNHRPKTAPAQSSNLDRPRHRPSPSSPSSFSRARISSTTDSRDPTPLSTFNTAIDKLVLPSARESRVHEPSPYPPLHVPASQSNSTRIPKKLYIDIAPKPFAGDSSPSPPRHHRRPSPLQLQQRSQGHSLSSPQFSVSGPIPGCVIRNEVTYAGTPLSVSRRVRNLSLEEAQRREKPLPPLGPMSPSIVKGVVEIGTPKCMDEWGRELKFVDNRELGKKKPGFGGLFKWSKKEKGNIR